MNDDWKRALLIYPTTILALLSFIASLYVFISAFHFKTKLINNQIINFKKIGKKIDPTNDIRLTNDYTVTDIIMWMSLFELIFDTWLLFNYLAQTISDTYHYSEYVCRLLGIFGNFGGLSSPLWHLIMAWNLFYLLTNKSRNDYFNYDKFSLIKQKPTLISLLLIFTISGTIVPIIGRAFGEFNNSQHYNEWECWIYKKGYQLIVLIPIIVSVLFNYIVLIIAYIRYVKTKSYTFAYKLLIKRLIVWIVVFSILRSIPTFVRLMGIFHLTDDIPFILIAAHHYCFALWGFGNGLVWWINRNCVDTSRLTPQYSQTLVYSNSNNNNNGKESINTDELKKSATGTSIQNTKTSHQTEHTISWIQ
mmetsp:Transcript_70996/g.87100  ORF Transcript_70996/g.87100 Transcript_70996/m.87100 type:complete len:362 (-) Transcript_70996:33-1118(-)